MSETAATPRVAFWGLGNMGSPMASRLMATGTEVLGYDVSKSAVAKFVANGGTAISGPAGLADVSVVILMLPNSDIVDHVLLDDGVAAAMAPGSLVIDMGSSEPLRTQQLAARLGGLGLRLIDAPVSGGVVGAQNGTLSIMVGGSEADVADATPILNAFGTPMRVGPVGAGHALKALNNLLSATHLWATSEAILVGKRFGLEPEVMLSAINGSSGRSGSTQNKWPNFILPGSYDSGFSLGLMVKDMKIATDLAHRLGMPISLGDAAVEEWTRAAGELPPGADHTEVARFLGDQSRTASRESVS